MSPVCLRRVRENDHKKGDVLSVARIAGIQAAKQTSQLIPLCHNIMPGINSMAWIRVGNWNAKSFETQSPVIPESALLISVSFLSLARIAFLKGQSHQNYGHSKNFWNLGKIDQIGIDFEIFDERNQIVVTCSSKCFGKTGIEMEALVGASIRNVFYAQFVTSKYGRPDKYVCIWTKYVFTSTRVRNPSEFAGAGAARHKLQKFWHAFNSRSL